MNKLSISSQIKYGRFLIITMESVLKKNDTAGLVCNLKKVLNEQLQKMKSEYSPKVQNYLDILHQYEDSSLSLVFIGETCSGKTTLVNAIIAYLVLEDKKLIKDNELAQIRQRYEDLIILKAAITENTFSTTIIEPSNDDKYHLKVKKGRATLEKDYGNQNYQTTDLKGIKGYFEKLDKDAAEIIFYRNQVLQRESTNISSKEIEEKEKKVSAKMNEITIIQIPYITRKIRLYDLPGISGTGVQKTTEDIIASECRLPFICFTKNLTEDQAQNENIINILNNFLARFNGKVFFSLIFTKSDFLYSQRLRGSKYYSESNTDDDLECDLTDDSSKLAENFKSFSSSIDSNKIKLVDYQLINPTSILISKKSYSSSKKLQELQDLNIKKLSNWINSIESFFLKYEENLLEIDIKCKLKAQINQDFGNSTNIITPENINEIEYKKQMIINKFSNVIRNFVKRFPSNSTTLKRSYRDLYNLLMNSIKSNEDDLEWYFVRNNYIEAQINLIQHKFEIAILQEISQIIKSLLLEMWNSFSEEVQMKLEYGMFSSQELSLGKKSFVENLVIFSIVGTSLSMIPLGILIGSELLLPGIGVALAGITLLYSSMNYIGFWTKSGAREDIIDSMLESIAYNSANIIKSSEEYFARMVTNMTNNLIKIKEKSTIDTNLCKVVDSVKVKQLNFSPLKISTTMIDKISEDKSLKPGVINFFCDIFRK